MENLKFTENEEFAVQTHGVNKFFKPLNNDLGCDFNISQVELFAFKTTFGSNLDPEDEAVDISGNRLSLDKDIYPKYDIILATTDYSLTAPHRQSKGIWVSGSNLHGLNEIILNSGLSVDYNEISRRLKYSEKC